MKIPARYRSALYIITVITVVLSVVLATAMSLGYITQEAVVQWVENFAFAMSIVSGIVARFHVPKDEG